MKRIYTLLIFSLASLLIQSQNQVEAIVLEGIEYHDAGDYDKAIEIYETALELDPNSPLVLYEIAYSYFKKQDYDNAISYADRVLQQNDEHLLAAYLVKGSSLDLKGQIEASNEVFEKGIRETGEHYLFYYNMGFNYFKAGDLTNSEKNILKALENNFQHSTSHLVLAKIHSYLNNPVKVLLASHFFLFLEPATFRSEEAYEFLKKAMSGNVSRNDEKPNTINIDFTPRDDDPFSTATLMLSLLEASKFNEQNILKSNTQLFIENTKSIFNILGDPTLEKDETIWFSEYIPFFREIAMSEHLETYCMYILHNFDEEASKWLLENENKLDAFSDWFNE